MTDYLFNGYYGYRNIGDDVFCVVADWGSKKYWGAEHSAFMAPELPKLSAPAQCVIPTQKKYPGHETIARSWATLAAKNIVYFGGSTLHSPQENWMTLARHPFVRSISGKRIAAVGVSVGPFRSQESLAAVKTFLSEMSFISVRDQASYAILQDMNIDVPMVRAFDPAVLLLDVIADEMIDATKGQPVTELTRSRKILGVSVCCAERYVGGDLDVEKKRISTITAALKKLKKSDVLFRFF